MFKFGLFTKQKKNVETQEKTITWNEELRMTEFIVYLMSEYLKKCQGDIVLVKEKPELEKELTRLKELGLGNSVNAKILEDKITERQEKKDKCEFGKEVIEFIKILDRELPGSYLISFEQFWQIIGKYKLRCKPISRYTGTIPSQNIKEIENTYEKLRKDDLKVPINIYSKNVSSRYQFFWYISRLDYQYSENKNNATSLMEFIEEHGSIVAAYNGSCDSTYTFSLSSDKFEDARRINSWILDYQVEYKSGFHLRGEKLTRTDLMIAAPENCFDPEYKVKEIPVDPIVFQCCPYGIIVHSVWGEEADDKVLEQYRELNKSILGE